MEDRKGASPIRLVTPGFFREDKGLEAVLYALRDLRDRGYNVSYATTEIYTNVTDLALRSALDLFATGD